MGLCHTYLSSTLTFFFIQLKVISLAKNSRYQPLKDVNNGGIIVMRDTQSDQPEVIVETVKAGGPVKEEETSEPAPPEPFEWVDE